MNENQNASVIYHPLDKADVSALELMKSAALEFREKVTGSNARLLYDQFVQQTAPAEGISYKEDTIGGVNGWWCLPKNATPAKAFLYFHGGAYNVGSAFAYRNFVGHIASLSNTAVFIPGYRLAPENPYPAAVNDGKNIYLGLPENGYNKISIVGDSAGGGLGLVILEFATAKAARGECPKPVSAAVISPWTDLAFESPSLKSNAAVDMILTEETLKQNASGYLNNEKSKNPQVSPVYGNLDGLPPIQIHVGEAEILLDDSIRYATRASQTGVSIDLHVWEGMPHVFPSNVNKLKAANKAVGLIGSFLMEQ